MKGKPKPEKRKEKTRKGSIPLLCHTKQLMMTNQTMPVGKIPWGSRGEVSWQIMAGSSCAPPTQKAMGCSMHKTQTWKIPSRDDFLEFSFPDFPSSRLSLDILFTLWCEHEIKQGNAQDWNWSGKERKREKKEKWDDAYPNPDPEPGSLFPYIHTTRHTRHDIHPHLGLFTANLLRQFFLFFSCSSLYLHWNGLVWFVTWSFNLTFTFTLHGFCFYKGICDSECNGNRQTKPFQGFRVLPTWLAKSSPLMSLTRRKLGRRRA